MLQAQLGECNIVHVIEPFSRLVTSLTAAMLRSRRRQIPAKQHGFVPAYSRVAASNIVCRFRTEGKRSQNTNEPLQYPVRVF